MQIFLKIKKKQNKLKQLRSCAISEDAPKERAGISKHEFSLQKWVSTNQRLASTLTLGP